MSEGLLDTQIRIIAVQGVAADTPVISEDANLDWFGIRAELVEAPTCSRKERGNRWGTPALLTD